MVDIFDVLECRGCDDVADPVCRSLEFHDEISSDGSPQRRSKGYARWQLTAPGLPMMPHIRLSTSGFGDMRQAHCTKMSVTNGI